MHWLANVQYLPVTSCISWGIVGISGGFKVTGWVATQCSLSEYVTGEVTVEHSAAPIYSIDVQLLRVESVASGDKMATETSEIQSTQASSSLLWIIEVGGCNCTQFLISTWDSQTIFCTCLYIKGFIWFASWHKTITWEHFFVSRYIQIYIYLSTLLSAKYSCASIVHHLCKKYKSFFLVYVQVADGDICKGLPMPIYMVLPRLFTCPTLSAGYVRRAAKNVIFAAIF